MSLYSFLLFFTCVAVSMTSNYRCNYPSIYDFPMLHDYGGSGWSPPSPHRTPLTTNGPPRTPPSHRTKIPVTTSTALPPLMPTRINTQSIDVPVLTRAGEELNTIQQKQMNELYCLEVLDKLIASQWQEDIDRLSVRDLGNFSTLTKVPEFKVLYSNPESEWIQDDGNALIKLDKCFRNLVSRSVPRMDQQEIDCLNKIYPDYLSRESQVWKMTEMVIKDSDREQLPFKTFYNYYEITELLFENRNIDALDSELRAIHEDMLDFYIKSEEDKSKKFFIIEQECEWKNARMLREVRNENERYQKFGRLVKSLVNRYVVSEILHKWVPGVMIPEYRYDLWTKARDRMENEIRQKTSEMQKQKRDAQFLCTHAAQLATKFFEEQKAILFDKMKSAALSTELKTREKYSFVLALQDILSKQYDNRLSRTQVLVNEFKEGHYCLTNFVRMIENHQRYMIATTFVNEVLPFGITYCQVKEMSAGLINPRYCQCQGTFGEEFGLATLRAQRFQLNLLPNGTYTVTTNSSYRILPLDELIEMANQRIADQKFKTWWYRHQKVPV